MPHFEERSARFHQQRGEMARQFDRQMRDFYKENNREMTVQPVVHQYNKPKKDNRSSQIKKTWDVLREDNDRTYNDYSQYTFPVVFVSLLLFILWLYI
jgi:hypothetical protein